MKLLTIFLILISITSTFCVLNFVVDSWIKTIITGTAPAPVSYHTGVLNPVNNTLLLFGGKDTSKIYNNLIKYDLIFDSWIPSNASNSTKSPVAAIPTARYGHVAVTTPFNTMYIFGGRNATHAMNDIYKYNMESDQWLLLNAAGTPPTSRYGHTGVMYAIKNQFIFFGGKTLDKDGGVFQNDILFYDFELDTWLPSLEFSNDTLYIPTERLYHSAIFTLTNEMVIFGGQDKNGNTASIHFFSAETNKWLNNTLNSTSEGITALNSHSSILTPLGTMLVFGGQEPNGDSTDSVWKFDFKYRTWSSILPGGLGPEAKFGHIAICSLFNTMIIFGGQSGQTYFYNDLSKYNVLSSVLRSASDGVVLVVLLSLVGAMIVGLCFALDLMNERNEIEKYEREIKENGAELKDIKVKSNKKSNNTDQVSKKEQRQPLFETF